jgi:hypothetical protein
MLATCSSRKPLLRFTEQGRQSRHERDVSAEPVQAGDEDGLASAAAVVDGLGRDGLSAVLVRTPGGKILDTLIHKYFTRSAMRWGTLLADLGVPCE